jgi:hypothetical protein
VVEPVAESRVSGDAGIDCQLVFGGLICLTLYSLSFDFKCRLLSSRLTVFVWALSGQTFWPTDQSETLAPGTGGLARSIRTTILRTYERHAHVDGVGQSQRGLILSAANPAAKRCSIVYGARDLRFSIEASILRTPPPMTACFGKTFPTIGWDKAAEWPRLWDENTQTGGPPGVEISGSCPNFRSLRRWESATGVAVEHGHEKKKERKTSPPSSHPWTFLTHNLDRIESPGHGRILRSSIAHFQAIHAIN